MSRRYTFTDTFKGIIREIDSSRLDANPRGLKVKESLLTTLPIDPTLPFPNFRNRKFNFGYFAGELAWYLKKDNDVDYISKFSGFWKNITNPGTNEINSNYGTLLFGEQLNWVVESLKSDKNSRQAIAFLNQPKFQFEGNKDFVCTMYLNFFIRNNKLHMKVQMRSNDIFYGLTFDAPFFAFVHQHVRLWLLDDYPDLELGAYYHSADNSHFYERHFDLADRIMKEDISNNEEYEMNIPEPMFTVNPEGMELTNSGETFIKMLEDFDPNDEDSLFYLRLLSPFLGIRRYGIEESVV
jgi:thymidylate synthase